jgi:hypothetical protein
MARARQGQDRWHRPEWGAPDGPPPRRRRWQVPVLLLILVGGVVWYAMHPERLPEVVRSKWSKWSEWSATSDPPASHGGSRLVYRWRDAKGVVQFTDQPPPEGVAYVPVHVDPNTNVLPPATSPWADR